MVLTPIPLLDAQLPFATPVISLMELAPLQETVTVTLDTTHKMFATPLAQTAQAQPTATLPVANVNAIPPVTVPTRSALPMDLLAFALLVGLETPAVPMDVMFPFAAQIVAPTAIALPLTFVRATQDTLDRSVTPPVPPAQEAHLVSQTAFVPAHLLALGPTTTVKLTALLVVVTLVGRATPKLVVTPPSAIPHVELMEHVPSPTNVTVILSGSEMPVIRPAALPATVVPALTQVVEICNVLAKMITLAPPVMRHVPLLAARTAETVKMEILHLAVVLTRTSAQLASKRAHQPVRTAVSVNLTALAPAPTSTEVLLVS